MVERTATSGGAEAVSIGLRAQPKVDGIPVLSDLGKWPVCKYAKNQP